MLHDRCSEHSPAGGLPRRNRTLRRGRSVRWDDYSARADGSDARDEAAWLAGQLGCASLIIEGAGHYPHVEAPGQFAAALVDFLGRLRPATS